MRLGQALTLVTLFAAVPACAAILGDDFQVDSAGDGGDDDDDGSGSGGCDGQDDCESCPTCACQGEIDTCNGNEHCGPFVQCVIDCGSSQECFDSCAGAFPDGVDDAVTLDDCLCAECLKDCCT